MTGLRAARINAGYRTAREAHAAFAKGKKGREALSLSYWQKLEATGPALMHPVLMKRLSQFLGCSANLIFAHTAEPMQKKGTTTPLESRRPRRAAATDRHRQTKGPKENLRASESTTMEILPHGDRS